jgi:hypothetical protein
MILIENEIVFLSVPKNASVSVHYALEASQLKIEPTWNYEVDVKDTLKNNSRFYNNSSNRIKIHAHINTLDVYNYFKKKVPTIFIKRDYGERFLSALNYVMNIQMVSAYGYDYFDILKSDIMYNIDNNWLYETFTKDVINNILLINSSDLNIHKLHKTESYEDKMHKIVISSLNKFIKNKKEIKIPKPEFMHFPNKNYINFKMLDSQEIYKSGYTPKHIFDIYELDKLENFIKEKFEKEIIIKKENSLDKNSIKTNFINDTKLRNWVWDNFEKRHFIKKLF